MDLGRAAFAEQAFGTAARRFGQVTEVAPHLPLGYFLRAEAEFALASGEAVNALCGILLPYALNRIITTITTKAPWCWPPSAAPITARKPTR